jgi:hypothetical protein
MGRPFGIPPDAAQLTKVPAASESGQAGFAARHPAKVPRWKSKRSFSLCPAKGKITPSLHVPMPVPMLAGQAGAREGAD